MEQQLTKYEQKQLRKQEKQEMRTQKQKRKQFAKWLIIILLVGILAAGLFFLLTREQTKRTDFSISVPTQGASHVSTGTTVNYQSNPPTSGNHWGTPLKDGLYDKEKPDEAIVHSMEHGRVWVSFKPSIPEETKQELIELLKNQPAVILTPRSQNDTDIALAAWGRLDAFNLEGALDKQRILDFIQNYLHKGPEYIPGPSGGSEY